MGGVAGPGAYIHMITCVYIYIFIYLFIYLYIRYTYIVIWFSGSRVPIAVRNGRGLRGARETARLVSQQHPKLSFGSFPNSCSSCFLQFEFFSDFENGFRMCQIFG